jgi:hypothetical protein
MIFSLVKQSKPGIQAATHSAASRSHAVVVADLL